MDVRQRIEEYVQSYEWQPTHEKQARLF
jgi:hypothetical protein